jgi:hypothetical protein
MGAAAAQSRAGRGIMDSANDEGGASTDMPEARRRITELQVEHRDLDAAIARLAEGNVRDDLQLRRLKKRKLLIKDAITRLEMTLIPDIPA